MPQEYYDWVYLSNTDEWTRVFVFGIYFERVHITGVLLRTARVDVKEHAERQARQNVWAEIRRQHFALSSVL